MSEIEIDEFAYESIVDDLIDEAVEYAPNNYDHPGNAQYSADAFETITGRLPEGDYPDIFDLPGGGHATYRISNSTNTTAIQISKTRKWDNLVIKFIE